jgi:hypothetical protein
MQHETETLRASFKLARKALRQQMNKFNIRPDDPINETSVRSRPAIFRALGASEPPQQISVDHQLFDQVEVFKHDSWAATAVYQCGNRKIVCKFNRRQSIGPIPMFWLGWILARRESMLLTKLSDLPNVPANSGPVKVGRRVLSNAVAHEFLPGRPLNHKMVLPTEFYDELKETLLHVHEKEIAYVDLHKPENIIVGDDGKPYLIDFQIAFWLPKWQPARIMSQWWLRLLQSSDHYHLLKHISKSGPCDRSEEIARNRPWFIRLHRRMAVPIRSYRRRLLIMLRIRSGVGSAMSEAHPEVGHRTAA